MADEGERQKIDQFPVDGDFEARRIWFTEISKGRSREEVILLANRAALRVLPMLGLALPQNVGSKKARDAFSDIILPTLRCCIVPVLASLTQKSESIRLSSAADAASRAAEFIVTAGLPEFATAATLSAVNAARIVCFADSALTATSTAAHLIVKITEIPVRPAVEAYLSDLMALGNGQRLQSRIAMAATPLWPEVELGAGEFEAGMSLGETRSTEPNEFRQLWIEFRKHLFESDDNWDVWIKWYDGIVSGSKNDGTYLFGLPTERALKLWHDVALIDDAIWKAGPAVLNAEFKRLVAEAKAEVAGSRLPSPSAPGLETPNAANPHESKRTKSKIVTPKTAAGKAILANAGNLALHSYSLVSILNSEVERLKQSRPNSDDAIKERDELIIKLEVIKSDVMTFQSALIAFSTAEISEKEVIKKADTILKPFRDCWTEKGKEFVEVATRSGLFLGAMSIAQFCGVPPLAGTLVFGAIASGKPLADVLKAAKGIVKIYMN